MSKQDKKEITKEEKRLNDIQYMMEHWDELPDRLQGRFEGIVSAVLDLSVKQSA